MIFRSFKLDHVYSGQLNLSSEGNFSFSCFSFSMRVHESVYVLHKSSMYVKQMYNKKYDARADLSHQKAIVFFFMVDLAPYYFHLSELVYYFKENFDYTIMIKENY